MWYAGRTVCWVNNVNIVEYNIWQPELQEFLIRVTELSKTYLKKLKVRLQKTEQYSYDVHHCKFSTFCSFMEYCELGYRFCTNVWVKLHENSFPKILTILLKKLLGHNMEAIVHKCYAQII